MWHGNLDKNFLVFRINEQKCRGFGIIDVPTVPGRLYFWKKNFQIFFDNFLVFQIEGKFS
jgi:hypothetical protein